MTKKGVIISAVIFTIGVITGKYFSEFLNPPRNSPQTAKAIRAGGFKYIAPLLYCDTPSQDELSFNSLKIKLENYINGEKADGLITDASVFFRTNGDTTLVNGDDKYSPASLLKIPVMMAYYKSAESDNSALSKEIKFDGTDQEDLPQNFKPDQALEKGKKYTVDELIKRMIIYSDNNAEDLLVAGIDQKEFDEVFNDMNITRFNYSHQEDSMDVATFSYFLRALYNATYLDRKMSEKALTLLTHAKFSDGIEAGVPKDTTVAHKFGERAYADSNTKQLHDCGIIYYPDHPYLLCVMTRGTSFDDLKTVLKTVSQMTYSAVKDKYTTLVKEN